MTLKAGRFRQQTSGKSRLLERQRCQSNSIRRKIAYSRKDNAQQAFTQAKTRNADELALPKPQAGQGRNPKDFRARNVPPCGITEFSFVLFP
jgi:hypothetical protein